MSRLRDLVGLALPFALAWGVVACGTQPSPTPTPAGLAFSIPWSDQEEAHYLIQGRSGEELGRGTLAVRRSGDLFIMTQEYDLGQVKDRIEMRVRTTDLKPVSETRTTSTPQGEVRIVTSYKEGKLSINAETPQGDKNAVIDVPADAYDNDEALFLLRALPLAEGYTLTYPNVVAGSALIPKVTITVVGREEVAVPAGTFECFKLELKAAQATQYLWYGVEPPHHLIKYDNGAIVFLLESTS